MHVGFSGCRVRAPAALRKIVQSSKVKHKLSRKSHSVPRTAISTGCLHRQDGGSCQPLWGIPGRTGQPSDAASRPRLSRLTELSLSAARCTRCRPRHCAAQCPRDVLRKPWRMFARARAVKTRCCPVSKLSQRASDIFVPIGPVSSAMST